MLENKSMKVLDLFSGAGMFSYGLELSGMKTIAFCEIEERPRKTLKEHWPNVPIHKDIRNLDGKQYKGTVELICGGFPCQDLSGAGNQQGLDGERSSLYTHMLRIISECLPRYAIFENVTNLIRGESGRWFAQFLYDLAQIGYDAEWHCIPASAAGAAHHRDRVWIIAYPNGTVREGIKFQKPLFTNPEESRRRQLTRAINACLPADDYAKMRPNFNDIPEQMARLKMIGNSIYHKIPELIGRAIMEIENAPNKT